MARTKQQLAVRVADELKLLGEGITLSAADAQTIKERYDDKLEDLEDQDLAYWPADSIPGGAMDGLVLVIADICAPAFGGTRDVNREVLGMGKLREHAATAYDGEPTEQQYF